MFERYCRCSSSSCKTLLNHHLYPAIPNDLHKMHSHFILTDLNFLSVLKTVPCQSVMSSIQTSLHSYKLEILSVLKMVSCLLVMSGLENQMAEHILQRCPLLQTARTNVWPTAVQLHTKLQGSKEELEKMATFILLTRLSVERESRRKMDYSFRSGLKETKTQKNPTLIHKTLGIFNIPANSQTSYQT